jgi:electron transfer flavoprotein beta subunit
MKIVVCIKQVPDTTNVKIDPQTNTLVREGVASIINPFDTYAIEEGVRIRERLGGKLTVITMGPPQAKDALVEAISLGSDEAVLISDRAFAGSDTWATSFVLAKAVQKIGNVDLIICGKQAADGDTAQVGPGIAARLDIPQITCVKKIEKIENKSILAQRMTEEGYEVVEAPLPCLITVVKEINEPRMPSLKGKLRAKSSAIPIWAVKDLNAELNRVGLKGSPTQVVKVFSPPPRKGGQILQGTPKETAEKLAGLLKDVVLQNKT